MSNTKKKENSFNSFLSISTANRKLIFTGGYDSYARRRALALDRAHVASVQMANEASQHFRFMVLIKIIENVIYGRLCYSLSMRLYKQTEMAIIHN